MFILEPYQYFSCWYFNFLSVLLPFRGAKFLFTCLLISEFNIISVVLFIQLIDNVPILQIDMVWCYFMLRDIRWLSDAGKRLEMARAGIERAHGKDSLRLRLLQGGRYPELALWVISANSLSSFFFPLKFLSYWDTIKSRLIIGCFFVTLYVGWILYIGIWD